ncbi:hypothetical protein B566_EDAN013026 [Ephemera danica]|nr:hypothetical protein B566_EDAN013026 [Ephemera danica]
MYGSDHSYSPYHQSPSPAAGYRPSPSPGGYASTPSPVGGAYQPSPSPSGPYGTPSPMGYSPMTAASPFNPQTPGAGMEHLTLQDWHTTDLEVRIKDTHVDAGLTGQTGVIRGISQLEPVVPQRGDQVKVILGEDREAVGTLLSIDNNEGVVKLSPDEVKMLQLRYLCRMRVD